MPNRDGTGPSAQGPGAGRGMGLGRGRGRMGGNTGTGPVGDCVCSSCGTRIPHKIGVPCSSLNCPQCGARMTRA